MTLFRTKIRNYYSIIPLGAAPELSHEIQVVRPQVWPYMPFATGVELTPHHVRQKLQCQKKSWRSIW